MSGRYRTLAAAVGYGMLLALIAVAILLIVTRRPAGQPIQLAPRPTAALLRVHVTGAAQTPGVYHLAPGSIVQDALAAAGGATDQADLSRINLARILVDGDQVVVPESGQVSQPGAESGEILVSGSTQSGGLININAATAAELETLPRIGPTLAQRIIDYRLANGPFTSAEDIMSVPGIGPATYEQIKDLILAQ